MIRSVCLSALLLASGVVSPGVSAQPPTPDPAAASSPYLLPAEKIPYFPVADERGWLRLHASCQAALEGLSHTGQPPDHSSDFESLQAFLTEVLAFTAPPGKRGERDFIASFQSSNDRALCRLREEVGLPVPDGGAIVRVYASKEVIPKPLRQLLDPGYAGFTHAGRFIVVNTEGESPEGAKTILSHELAHAYIGSSLGPEEDRLPDWFGEGAAMYLSDDPRLQVDRPMDGAASIASLQKRYNRYGVVFGYLESVLGREGVDRYIREAVEGRSAIEPLRGPLGIGDYGTLLGRAQGWRRGAAPRSWLSGSAFTVLLLAVLLAVLVRVRRLLLPKGVHRSAPYRQRFSQDRYSALQNDRRFNIGRTINFKQSKGWYDRYSRSSKNSGSPLARRGGLSRNGRPRFGSAVGDRRGRFSL